MRKRFPIIAVALAFCSLGLVLSVPTLRATATTGFEDLVHNPQWGPDIRINPDEGEGPSAQRNYSVAINPTNPNNVLATFESQGIHSSRNGHAWSTDAGRTWASSFFTGTWGSDGLTPLGNTNVAFDNNGVAYYTSLAVGSVLSGFYVLTTTNGTDWNIPVPIVVSSYDQYRSYSGMAVDSSPGSPYAGSVYIFWLYTDTTFPYLHGISMRYSRDGGHTWSNDVQISDPGNEYSRNPTVNIASDGTIYVAFEQIENFYVTNPPKLYLDRSTDGGLTWGTDRLVSGEPVTTIGRLDWKGHELTLIGTAMSNDSVQCTLMRIHHFPSMAVSPTDTETVYVAWNDGRWSPEAELCGMTGRHSDIAFSKTTDGGATWTAASRLNNDPIGTEIDQFQPTLGVRSDGLLGAIWYDRRFDLEGYLYDLVYTQSEDGGLTWSPDTRVSDASSNADEVQDYKGIDDVGYRKSLVYGPGYVLPTWLRAREGTRQGDFNTDRGVFAPVPALVGHVNWQSHPPQPSALQQLPLTLTLKLGTTEVNYPAQMTDPYGFFTVSAASLPTGTYSWRVKGPRFLANSGVVQLSGGPSTTNVEMGMLRAGDSDSNDAVNIYDFNIVKRAFGTTVGDPGYDDRADFTGDQAVNIADFNIQKVNFGSAGAPPIGVDG